MALIHTFNHRCATFFSPFASQTGTLPPRALVGMCNSWRLGRWRPKTSRSMLTEHAGSTTKACRQHCESRQRHHLSAEATIPPEIPDVKGGLHHLLVLPCIAHIHCTAGRWRGYACPVAQKFPGDLGFAETVRVKR